jgi:RecA/RadA recombinase
MNKMMNKLRKLEGTVVSGYDPQLNCAQTPSPSVNWAFGTKGWGLPYGYSMVLYGPPKGGKSIICNAMIGTMHQNDPEAIAITFNTELRGELQANEDQMKTFGIDPERFIVYDVNSPEMIFDRIEHDIAGAIEEGAKIKMIVIDSITNINGRRTMNANTVMQQQIGDRAATIQDGLMRIMPIIRKHRIALVMAAHVRAELDMAEQMRGNKVKMAGAFGLKHQAEFFVFVEPVKSKEGKTDILGKAFVDDSVKDIMDKEQRSGHKIRLRVMDTSIGIGHGRTAEFSLDYRDGIINTHEEVFRMGVNLGVIERPNNVTYIYKDKNYKGIAAIVNSMKDDKDLTNDILNSIKARDLEVLTKKV